MRLGVNPKMATVREILAQDKLHLLMAPSGLADRLYILGGFLALCSFLKKEPQIYWPVNEYCNGKLSDLYDLDFACTEFNISGLKSDVELRNIAQGKCVIGKDLIFFQFRGGMDMVIIYKMIIGIILPKHISIENFEETAIQHLKKLRLKPNIKQSLDAFVEKHFVPNIPIGIHIRRTDMVHDDIGMPKKYCIAEWQLPNIDKLAFSLIEKHAIRGTHFFLACDNAQYQKKIRQFLLEHECTVATYVNTFTSKIRQTSLENAVCDMYLLSHCKKILRCGPSGFSLLAARLGSIPTESVQALPSWYCHFFDRWIKLGLMENFGG